MSRRGGLESALLEAKAALSVVVGGLRSGRVERLKKRGSNGLKKSRDAEQREERSRAGGCQRTVAVRVVIWQR